MNELCSLSSAEAADFRFYSAPLIRKTLSLKDFPSSQIWIRGQCAPDATSRSQTDSCSESPTACGMSGACGARRAGTRSGTPASCGTANFTAGGTMLSKCSPPALPHGHSLNHTIRIGYWKVENIKERIILTCTSYKLTWSKLLSGVQRVSYLQCRYIFYVSLFIFMTSIL